MINYAAFNLWANKTFADWLKTKPEELLIREIPSSYPSIILTVLHIRNTERFWLSALNKLPPTAFDPGFEGNITDALLSFENQSVIFSEYVNSQSEYSILETFKLDMPWMKGQVPKYEIIQHCLNHSTYHMGQIITIGRNVGIIDPPMTDYNYYNMKVRSN